MAWAEEASSDEVRRTYVDTAVLAPLERLEPERVQLAREGEHDSAGEGERALRHPSRFRRRVRE